MSRDLKLFIRYITPSMAGMLIAGLYSIVDTFFIGKAVGAVGLAAAALTWPVVMLSGALGDMIGTGAAILLSQERGAGNHATANRAFCCMILAEIVVGALFAALLIPVLPAVLRGLGATPELFDGAYRYALILVGTSILPMLAMGCIAVMRNDGQPVLAMWLVVIGLVSNIILDYLFIFPFGWGLAGAAAATAIAQSLTVVFGACYFRSGRTALRLTLAGLRPDWRILGICFRNGIPTLGAQLSIIGMLLMHNYQSLRYAAVAGLAAYSLIAAIESMGSMLMTGLAAGVQPLVSYFHGARKHRRKLRLGYYGLWTGFGLGVVMMIVSIAGYRIFPAWFGLDGNVASLAGRGLLISAPTFLLLGVVRVGSYYFQSSGRLAAASVLIYGDTCLALPLCLFILPLWLGIDGVWAAMPVSRVLLFAVLACYWHRFNWKGKQRELANA